MWYSFHIIALARPSSKLFTPITLIIFLHQQMTTLGVGRSREYFLCCVYAYIFSSPHTLAHKEMRVSETLG